eukprot:13756788-Ditylum_brightwellii.AAC.1
MVDILKQVKQALRGQNVGNMNDAYTLVQNLLRVNTLTAFNNKQAMFKEQTMDKSKHYLDAMTVLVFPNKAYKLQKQYIQYMMHKTRHIPVCKWIARVVKLNNYLTEFSISTRVDARKLEHEELLK